MDELEKMRRGELFDFSSPEVSESLRRNRRNLERFNHTSFDAGEAYGQAITALIPGIPASARIMPPFFCDHGYRIQIGEGTFINANCTMLDCGGITIGAHCKIGPNCQLYTPQHPIDYLQRREPQETGIPIQIGDDCWLGGGVVVCPGVRIGDRCIIGAGSVVTRDIPDDSLAVGNPAVVKRKLK